MSGAPIVFQWDWKDSPDWDAINTALRQFPTPHFCGVDTGSDFYAVVLADEPITKEEAEEIFSNQE